MRGVTRGMLVIALLLHSGMLYGNEWPDPRRTDCQSVQENTDASASRAANTTEIDGRPLPIRAEDAFPNLRITLPVVLTHAGDGSRRIFVGSQLGDIHVVPQDRAVEETKVFLDLRPKVVWDEVENEEGLLGLAFHPKYKKNGQFFVYYTTTDAPHTSVISRFRVSATDPDCADPKSEVEIMRIPQPDWNHNGGTLEFGPDGYLYIGLGDGGGTRDPHGNGQNLATLHGSILRIDIDHQSGAQNYAVPKDNPFVDRPGARPEIWAYGLRNVWRMAFDRQTNVLWAADNGEDLWEEIDLITRGGNYGWNLREGKHKFGLQGSAARPDLIEPIWEYRHRPVGSIIGGCVYRGPRVPELQGAYLYADYITGALWALRYDVQRGQVTENRPIQSSGLPVITFGQDEDHEVYVTTNLGGGIIYWFAPLPPTGK
jgi:glucose/arabinose dehydrogenase